MFPALSRIGAGLGGSVFVIALVVGVIAACGSTTNRATFDDEGGTGTGFGDGASIGEAGTGIGDIGGRDPVNCGEAAEFKTYVGCDYYPTITPNVVQDVFDFAVAVANVGANTANVTVTGPNSVNQTITVAAGQLGKVYLPWVTSLKGPGGSPDQASTSLTSSILVAGGAYHLVSDVPVVVYQFSPLEFHGVGGPPGKNWNSCLLAMGVSECYSYSNDASLLLPTTAMTGNYRIMGPEGSGDLPPYFVVTGTAANTTVTVTLGSAGMVVGGGGVTGGAPGGTTTFMLNAGDVAAVIGGTSARSDLSGSLLKADHPVQVITGISCANYPAGVQACDHVEETVFPVETLGRHYVVMRPTGPKANTVPHVVHFFGNVDGTTLTYLPSKPSGCPDFLNAGQIADCGQVQSDFEVKGDHEFGIATFMVGGEEADPSGGNTSEGDPSQSFSVAVEQYRKTYVFLAPTDYTHNFVDVVAGDSTTITLDGVDVSGKLTAITGTGYFQARLALSDGQDGAHTLTGSNPVGIQVLGYGLYTSFQYPGGLNLSAISSVPVK